MKNIKTVTIKLTDPVSKQWFTVDVNLDFTERTEPVKSMHLDNSGSTKQWYQCKAIVKVHGVFPSCRGYTASSQRVQFH